MNEIVMVVEASWLSGVAAFAGGLLARAQGTPNTEQKRELIHGVVAFGGGILTAAIAFALIPEAISVLAPAGLATTFCLGGLAFCALDAWLSRRGGSKAQFMAMLMDFIPEAIALDPPLRRQQLQRLRHRGPGLPDAALRRGAVRDHQHRQPQARRHLPGNRVCQ